MNQSIEVTQADRDLLKKIMSPPAGTVNISQWAAEQIAAYRDAAFNRGAITTRTVHDMGPLFAGKPRRKPRGPVNQREVSPLITAMHFAEGSKS